MTQKKISEFLRNFCLFDSNF